MEYVMNIQSINPATEEVIATYDLMTDDQIKEILRKSHEIYGSWKSVGLDKRISLFKNLAGVLRRNKEEYSKLMTQEMGKPISQAEAEVEKCAWTCEVYADNVRSWLKEEQVDADGKKHLVVFQPLGVILSVMPWNFPFWQVFRFAIPTIIAGNTSILKHSNNVPGCALAIEKAFTEAGFPDQVFSTILADHEQVQMIMENDIIQGVSLTGSTFAGKKIAEIAGLNLKKVVLELGGSDPFIVFEDVNLKTVIKNAVFGRVQNNGQSCIAAKRFFVHKNIIDEFSERYAKAMGELVMGDPMDPDIDIGPMANRGEYETIIDQVNDAKSKNAKILTGGSKGPDKGYFFEPTVISNTTSDMKVVHQEVFGPVAPVIPFSSEEEAVKLANDSQFGLGASVWTSDLERGDRVARNLEVGTVFINSIVKSDPRMPFGGVKTSGIGRELSKYGLKEFVNVKGLNVYGMNS